MLEVERSASQKAREELGAAAREASEAARRADLEASQMIVRLEAQLKEARVESAKAEAESASLGVINRELAAGAAKAQHDRAEAEVRNDDPEPPRGAFLLI